jgi:hypothetical protein
MDRPSFASSTTSSHDFPLVLHARPRQGSSLNLSAGTSRIHALLEPHATAAVTLEHRRHHVSEGRGNHEGFRSPVTNET